MCIFVYAISIEVFYMCRYVHACDVCNVHNASNVLQYMQYAPYRKCALHVIYPYI